MQRLRYAVSTLLVVVLLAPTPGCYSAATVVATAAEPPSPYFEDPIYGITTVAGEDVTFDVPGEIRVRGIAIADASRRATSDAEIATINGLVGGVPYEIPLADVEHLWLEQDRFSKGKTGALLGAIGGFFVVVIVAMMTRDS